MQYLAAYFYLHALKLFLIAWYINKTILIFDILFTYLFDHVPSSQDGYLGVGRFTTECRKHTNNLVNLTAYA